MHDFIFRYYKMKFDSLKRSIQYDSLYMASKFSFLATTLDDLFEFLTSNLNTVLKKLFSSISIVDYVYSMLFTYKLKVRHFLK